MRSGRIMSEAAIHRLHEMGFPEIRPRWIDVLRHVEDGPIRPGQLAVKLSISKQATHKLVSELVAANYLAMDVDPADKRARRVSITDKGLQTWKAGLEEMQRLETGLVAKMSSSKVERLKLLSMELLHLLEDETVS